MFSKCENLQKYEKFSGAKEELRKAAKHLEAAREYFKPSTENDQKIRRTEQQTQKILMNFDEKIKNINGGKND